MIVSTNLNGRQFEDSFQERSQYKETLRPLEFN